MLISILFNIILIGGMNAFPAQNLHLPIEKPFYQPSPLVDSVSFALLGSTLYANECCGVTADNGYMYILETFPGYNGQIKVFDIHNPSNPYLYSATNIPNYPWTNNPYVGRNISKKSNFLVVSYVDWRTSKALLATFDVLDPSLPIYLNSLDIGTSDCWGMSTRDWVAYVCRYNSAQPSRSGIISIDFSSPQSPVKRDSFPGFYYDFALGKNYLYAYCSDTAKIYTTDSLGYMSFDGDYVFGNSRSISGIHAWHDSLIFVINFDYQNNLNILSIIDVYDPANAILVTEDTLPFFGFYGAYGITGDDSTLFYTQDSLLCVIDISNPVSPNFLSTFPMPYRLGGSKGMFLRDDILFTANDIQGTQIVDVSNPSSPQLLGRYLTNGLVNGVALQYPFAYVAAGGLAVLNISNPSNPEILGIYGRQLLKKANDITCDGHYVFVGSNSGITIFDISNPTIPIYKSHLSVDNIQRLLLHDSLLVASNPNLYIVDIAHPSNPQVLYSCDSVYISDFDIYGNLFCWVGIIDTTSFLQILDITDPSNPMLIGSVDIYRYPLTIAINDTLAYVTNDVYSQVVNLADPSNPYIVSTFSLSDANDTKIANNKLFTVDNYNYGSRAILSVFDLTNPITPHRIASSLTDGTVYSNKLTILNKYIYLCNREAFSIFEFSETDIALENRKQELPFRAFAYPNPFGSKINISLSCKKNIPLQVCIFDIAGRKLKTFFDRKPASNMLLLRWNGNDEQGKQLPGGIYYLRIIQGKKTSVQKIVKLE